MTKNILLAATALSALALAGTASAQTISAASVSNVPVVVAGTVTPYYIATESAPVAANRLTTTTATHNITTSNSLIPLPPGGANTSYLLTYNLAGTATPTFQRSITSADFSHNGAGTCTTASSTPTVVEGGGAGQSFVRVLFTITTANCTSTAGANQGPTSFTLDAPLQIAALGTVTGAHVLTTPAGGALPTGTVAASAARTLVNVAGAYAFLQGAVVDGLQEGANAPDNADLATRLALQTTGAPYRSFSGDGVIGAVNFGLNTTPTDAAAASVGGTVVRANLANAALPAATYNLAVNATGGSTFAIVRPGTAASDNAAATPTAFTTNTATSGSTSSAGGSFNAAQNVVVSIPAANTTQVAMSAQTYQAVISPVLNGGTAQTLITAPGAVTFDLETVNLEGTNFIAPWLQMQSPNYNAIVRISNNGTATTGPIQLTLRSNNGGTVNTTCALTQNLLTAGTLVGGGIAANSAIEFSGRTLANSCFGTTSTNADLQVTIQASSTNLTAKVRVINPDASISESQLGRLNELGGSF